MEIRRNWRRIATTLYILRECELTNVSRPPAPGGSRIRSPESGVRREILCITIQIIISKNIIYKRITRINNFKSLKIYRELKQNKITYT